jgi:ankyrin repeat protein
LLRVPKYFLFMNGHLWGAVGLAIVMLGLPACRKSGSETLQSDLGDAGYQLTAVDWFRAARQNDVAALKKFVAGKFPADTRDGAGDTALHAAAGAGAQGSADYLMDRGLAVDVRGASARTPLMVAVTADQTEMVKWLLRQGADANLKDQEEFKPLMIAVREGKAGSVMELAPYNREDLDAALLLAALVGRTDVIDTLTNFGASVYARMEDGRTPLMVAAENGHGPAVKLLLDLGSSRLSTNQDGKLATELAISGGHPEVAALISREALPFDLVLESPMEVAKGVDNFLHGVVKPSRAEGDAQPLNDARISTPIEGETLSAPMAVQESVGSPVSAKKPPAVAAVESPGPSGFRMPPLVMRHYRESELPISVITVEGDEATVGIAGTSPRLAKVRAGDVIPDSRLKVVRVQRRMESSKVSQGRPAEISVVEVRDDSSGRTREWISGVPASSHDPVALVEDAATGKRYVASPGQRFKAADGTEYLVSDVRPNQMIIQEVSTGMVQTIPLRGPRG